MKCYHYVLTSAEHVGFYIALALAQDGNVTVFDNAIVSGSYGLIPKDSEDDLAVNVLKRLDRWIDILRFGLSMRMHSAIPCSADVIVQVGTDLVEDEIRYIARMYDMKYIKVEYQVTHNLMRLAIRDGRYGDEDEESREWKGISLSPARLPAMLGGAWAASVIQRFMRHEVELPQMIEFPL